MSVDDLNPEGRRSELPPLALLVRACLLSTGSSAFKVRREDVFRSLRWYSSLLRNGLTEFIPEDIIPLQQHHSGRIEKPLLYALLNGLLYSSRSETESAMEKLLVSRKEAALALSISLRAIAYLIAERRLKTRKIGGRTLIAVEELKRFAGQDHRDVLVPTSQAA